MKRIIFYIFPTILIFLIIGGFIFFKKTHLKFNLVSEVQNNKEEFYPLAYEFFHSKDSYESFFERNIDTKELKIKLPKSSELDFKNYSYCIFFGRSIKDLYYSYKTTYYDDPSPSYASCRRKGKKFVVANYYTNTENNKRGIFLYKVIKNNSLSGVDGL